MKNVHVAHSVTKEKRAQMVSGLSPGGKMGTYTGRMVPMSQPAKRARKLVPAEPGEGTQGGGGHGCDVMCGDGRPQAGVADGPPVNNGTVSAPLLPFSPIIAFLPPRLRVRK